MKKPKLSIEGQIEHLRNKGVTFQIMSEDKAKDYLLNNNNLFKLTSYRKNYQKRIGNGPDAGKYLDLDFAYLVDLAIIDMNLRYSLIHMSLDIEHYVKMQLLHNIETMISEDGYSIIADYKQSLPPEQVDRLNNEISSRSSSEYCGAIIQKYDPDYPIWAFLEIISFGTLISFYHFCSKRWNSRQMLNNYYVLLSCKHIRNACAHSNCILNNLHQRTTQLRPNYLVEREIMKIPNITKSQRSKRMSNLRIQQIISLFYAHKTFVTSSGVRDKECRKIRELSARFFKHFDYYDRNPLIQASFNFIKTIIDGWF